LQEPKSRYQQTGLWRDACEIPEALAATIDRSEGVAALSGILGDPTVKRIVVAGNGAAYYVALALWLTTLQTATAGPEVVAVPAGLLVTGRFRWRAGDRLLGISSSGEFRDLVEAVEAGAPRPLSIITANANSTLASAADVVALQVVLSQRAASHTQALSGALALGLLAWAQRTNDAQLAASVRSAPEAAADSLEHARRWAAETLSERASPPAAIALGGNSAWAAALETALLLKEVSRIPAEGVETREGATSAMFGLASGHTAVLLPTSGDAAMDEAERLCRAAGANILRCPGGDLTDSRLALVMFLPAAVAVAVQFGLASKQDVDQPSWTESYYSTARAGQAT
jgi:fructoselysine-6-P-deglycase FrlB-like protein